MASNLFYRSEMVNYLKSHALDLIGHELNNFSDDNSDAGNIAFRNRVAGIIDLIDHMEVVTKEPDDDE